MTAEQLEASRAERLRQNGHGAVTIEDVRTWIEETGLSIFLPRSAQAGFTAPTFVEAVAGQRTTEPTLELIQTAESLLVRLEAEGVAVRLNLAGQPGDQPDYVVAGWVLPYIYALRGDRDWRRSPQLTGSRQVSPLAVQAAKQLDTGNQTAMQVRDALGKEVTESAVLRALHELWKQLRIIPVVPEVGQSALWQPLRQRFQKAIAEGASTSQVTAISVLASIYLQAVVAASMEDVEMFLSPLTSRSKIREVVRGLAATRQVHTTSLGQSPMFYVAGTLPEFPVAPSFQISASFPPYRGSSYLGLDHDIHAEDEIAEPVKSHSKPFDIAAHEAAASEGGYANQRATQQDSEVSTSSFESDSRLAASAEINPADNSDGPAQVPLTARQKPLVDRAHRNRPAGANSPASSNATAKAAAAPRPRAPRSTSAGRTANPAPRDRGRGPAANGDSRNATSGDRRRAPSPRGAAPSSNGSRSAASSRPTSSPRAGSANGAGNRGAAFTKSAGNGYSKSNGSSANGSKANGSNGHGKGGTPSSNGNGHSTKNGPLKKISAAGGASRSTGAPTNGRSSRPESGSNNRSGSGNFSGRPASGFQGKAPAGSKPGARTASGSASGSKPHQVPKVASRAASFNTEDREPSKTSAAKRYSFSGQAPKSVAKRPVGQSSQSGSKSSVKVTNGSRNGSGNGSGTASRIGSSPNRSSATRSAESKRRG